MRFPTPAVLALMLAACAPTPHATPAAATATTAHAASAAAEAAAEEASAAARDAEASALAARAALPPAGRGLAFARENCAGCHAVTAPGLSPSPEAPPFETVVAAPGLTARTLSTFLRDNHSFPGAMDFAIDRDAIDDLTTYMLTLRPKQ